MEILSNNNLKVEVQRGRGGQPGNQNARKHGFYSKVFDKQGKEDVDEARQSLGLEEEIAVMRAKILGILRSDPNNATVLTKAMATLCRLLETHKRVGKGDKNSLREAVMYAFRNLAPEAFGALMGKFFGD